MERFCSAEQKAVFGHADPAFGHADPASGSVTSSVIDSSLSLAVLTRGSNRRLADLTSQRWQVVNSVRHYQVIETHLVFVTCRFSLPTAVVSHPLDEVNHRHQWTTAWKLRIN